MKQQLTIDTFSIQTMMSRSIGSFLQKLKKSFPDAFIRLPLNLTRKRADAADASGHQETIKLDVESNFTRPNRNPPPLPPGDSKMRPADLSRVPLKRNQRCVGSLELTRVVFPEAFDFCFKSGGPLINSFMLPE